MSRNSVLEPVKYVKKYKGKESDLALRQEGLCFDSDILNGFLVPPIGSGVGKH